MYSRDTRWQQGPSWPWMQARAVAAAAGAALHHTLRCRRVALRRVFNPPLLAIHCRNNSNRRIHRKRRCPQTPGACCSPARGTAARRRLTRRACCLRRCALPACLDRCLADGLRQGAGPQGLDRSPADDQHPANPGNNHAKLTRSPAAHANLRLVPHCPLQKHNRHTPAWASCTY